MNRIRLYISLFLVFSLASCGGSDNGTVPSEERSAVPVVGDWAVLHELSDPEGLNPLVTNDASTSDISRRVFESLLMIDFETAELIPLLAESRPEVSSDGREYRFKLRKDVHFSDGKRMTADDVVFTFKVIKNPFITDAAPARNYFLDIEEVIATDEYSVVMKLTKPYFLAEYFIGDLKIMPRHIQDPRGLTSRYSIGETLTMESAGASAAVRDFANWYNSAAIKRDPVFNIGTGPYRYEEWKTNEKLVLVRRADYWGGNTNKWTTAYPEKLVYRTMSDRSSAVTALKNNELDFMSYVPPLMFDEQVDTSRNPHLQKSTYELPTYMYIGWNTRNPVLSDARVRKALTRLVDKESLIKQVVRGYATPIASPLYRQRPEYDNELPVNEYNPTEARLILEGAGWKDTDGDGFLDKVIGTGKRTLSFTFLLNAGNEMRERIALLLVDEFKKVGIKVSVQKLEWSVFLENLRTHSFDAFIGAWVNNNMPSDPYQVWHSSQAVEKGSNYVGFVNAEADSLIVSNRAEFNEDRRIELMKRFQKIVYEEQPYTFLWQMYYPAVHNKRLHNVHFYSVRPGYEPNNWFVPRTKWRYVSAPVQ